MKEGYKTAFIIILAIILAFVCIFLAILILNDYNYSKSFGNIDDLGSYVERVIDGDTFVLASGEQVRLICIDAPELSDNGGENSKEYLESLILNKNVRLEGDIDDKDAYGRLLRYVYVNVSNDFMPLQDKEFFVNKDLVENGFAEVWVYGNDTKRCDEIND